MTRPQKYSFDKNILIAEFDLYNKSIHKTAKSFGVSDGTIKRYLNEYGIEYNHRATYSFNENFFDELNEKSLYWLGFLTADGCISDSNNRSRINLGLATIDMAHIELFKKQLDATNKICNRIKKVYNNLQEKQYFISEINITSRHMVNVLAQYNIIPRKTFTIRFPKLLMEHKEVNHYIRGLIDGDGWIYEIYDKLTNKIKHITIGLCGYAPFMQEIFDFLKEKLNLEWGEIRIRKDGKFGSFTFSAAEDTQKLINYLYKDAETYLQRKYNHTLKINEVIQNSHLFIVDLEELQAKYDELQSFEKVGKFYNISNTAVFKKMKENNLQSNELDLFIVDYDDFKLTCEKSKTIKEIAAHYGTCTATINRKLKEFNLTFDTRLHHFDPVQLASDYDRLGSLRAVARLYNTDHRCIKYNLKKFNIPIKTPKINQYDKSS